jgi:hypothetical protein
LDGDKIGVKELGARVIPNWQYECISDPLIYLYASTALLASEWALSLLHITEFFLPLRISIGRGLRFDQYSWHLKMTF